MDDTQGDERGADVLAVGEGRQALDVNPEQARERVGLGVTELRELGCDVLYRAMPLAQLHTGQGRALANRSGGGGESVGDQCRRQSVRASGDLIASGSELRGIALLNLGTAFAGELAHRVGAGVLGKKAQCGGGDVVVVAAHASVTGRGQDIRTGGAAAAATCGTSGSGLAFLDGALLGERVEVTAHSSRRQAQP